MWNTMTAWLLASWLTIGAVQTVAAPAIDADHASLRAYPEAVLSAQDAKTGITVRVEKDGRHVAGLSKNGDILWLTEVIGHNGSCVAGQAVVRHLQVDAGRVIVTFCKHSYGEIDLETGKYRFLGQD
ncbi:MAG: hypothetical protein EKK71_05965 [Candidatus Competibacteraceae bacterium]|nr:MAG: hypothetical protein EKK71_05965 [Candidatus Competibacteraceae bacterium]